MRHKNIVASFASARPARLLAAALIALPLLQACGDKSKDKAATQTAAKVNKEEITVHQINYLLGRQRAMGPAAPASASGAILEQLIDQELTLEKAADQNLDREPAVVQQIEAARRDIISRAYLEKISLGAPKPTPQEIAAWYESHPALFKDRRVYDLQQLEIEATADQVAPLNQALAASKKITDFGAWLKQNNYRFVASQASRAAEQLPLARIDEFADMKDGSALSRRTPQGVEIIWLAASRSAPVTLQQATPAIEQFLLNDRKRKLIADDIKSLRGAARITYVGDFAREGGKVQAQAAADAARPPEPPPAPAPSLLPAVTAAPQIDVRPTEAPAASMPSSSTLDKGLTGLR